LHFLSVPNPKQDWFRFVARAGELLTDANVDVLQRAALLCSGCDVDGFGSRGEGTLLT
jgi:hypothetical protein